ncbi:MAG: DUF4286 family protein [Bacteroidota bacterium]|nr:DUF4286 family protein [Bacteroidota bacterium]MDP4251061.1 DUF4286 family protein [Bacteroidota bacterium]
MILYNSTTKIDLTHAQDWMAWQRREQIPQIMKTGLFEGHQMFRLLHQDDTEGYTYVIQFRAGDMTHYENFCQDHRSRFNRQTDEKWRGHYVCFESVMELVQ